MGADLGRRTTTRPAVDAVRAAIARGDVYQVNLVQHLSAPCDGRPRPALAAALAPLRPAAAPPVRRRRLGDRLGLAGALPGTSRRPAGDDADQGHAAGRRGRRRREGRCRARDDRRPRAERPLARLRAGYGALAGADGRSASSPGSRTSSRLVEGRAATRRRARGDPRARRSRAARSPARRRSRRSTTSRGIEPVGRGASMGALGTVWPNGDFELALTIRTFAVADGRIHLWVGGGIVWDSEPEAEIEESWVKARPLLAAVGGNGRARDAARGGRARARARRPGRRRCSRPTTRRCCAAARRSRRCASTAAVPFRLEPHIDRLRFSAQKLGAAAGRRRRRARRARRRRGAARLRAAALSHRRSCVVATAAALPDELEEAAGRAGSSLRTVEHRRAGAACSPASSRRATAIAFAARRVAERARCRRGVLVAGRARARGCDRERLVAARRRAASRRRRAPASCPA